MRQSTVAFGRISHIFPMKVDWLLTASSRMIGRVVFFLPHFAASFALRPHGCECPFFRPWMTKSSLSSRARSGGGAGSLTLKCSATPMRCMPAMVYRQRRTISTTSAPPPPPPSTHTHTHTQTPLLSPLPPPAPAPLPTPPPSLLPSSPPPPPGAILFKGDQFILVAQVLLALAGNRCDGCSRRCRRRHRQFPPSERVEAAFDAQARTAVHPHGPGHVNAPQRTVLEDGQGRVESTS